MAEEFVIIGKVTSAFGVKGWVKVFSFTAPPLNIINYSPLMLKIDGRWQPFEVLEGRKQGKVIAVSLKGLNDRNQAEALAGTEIGVDASQLPELESGEYYWRDLEGMSVVNQDGFEFGLVSHLIETGSNDVLVIRESRSQAVENAAKLNLPDTGKAPKPVERMVPYTPEAIISIDKEARQIIVEWDADF